MFSMVFLFLSIDGGGSLVGGSSQVGGGFHVDGGSRIVCAGPYADTEGAVGFVLQNKTTRSLIGRR
jgi:hypothetical protein